VLFLSVFSALCARKSHDQYATPHTTDNTDAYKSHNQYATSHLTPDANDYDMLFHEASGRTGAGVSIALSSLRSEIEYQFLNTGKSIDWMCRNQVGVVTLAPVNH
jgi:hypothetical protein